MPDPQIIGRISYAEELEKKEEELKKKLENLNQKAVNREFDLIRADILIEYADLRKDQFKRVANFAIHLAQSLCQMRKTYATHFASGGPHSSSVHGCATRGVAQPFPK